MKSRKNEVIKVSRGAKFDNLNYLQNLNQSGVLCVHLECGEWICQML